MEYKVPHHQEAMTDEQMVGKNPYSTNKYPTQSKKRKQKSSQKESTKKRKEAKANIPLQDIDTNDLLRDLGFEVVEESPQEKLPAMETLGAVKQEPLECFIHDCKLEKCTSQSGWEYIRCPMSDCFIFTGLDKVHHYLKIAQGQIPIWYKWNKEKLKCFCSESLVLCQSCSEKNPGRIYFKCQRNRCNFFQWGDEVPSGKNMSWMNNTEHVGIPDVRTILAKGHSDENLLWDQIQSKTRFTMTGIMNEIVFPPEVKGFTYGDEYRDDLLQIVYLMERLKRRQQFDKKRQQEIRKDN